MINDFKAFSTLLLFFNKGLEFRFTYAYLELLDPNLDNGYLKQTFCQGNFISEKMDNAEQVYKSTWFSAEKFRWILYF